MERSDHSSAEAEEEAWARATQMVADLSREFLALSTDDIDAEIERGMARAAALARADRVSLIVASSERGGIGACYEWAAPGVPYAPPRGDSESLRRFRHSASVLLRGDVLHLPARDALPVDAVAERTDLATRGVQSHLTIPVHSGSTLIGYLTFERTRLAGGWSHQQIEQLRLIGEIFASAVKRQETEAALLASRERYRALTEHATELVTEVDPSGVCLYASPSYFDILGYRPEEIEGRRLDFLMHPEDLEFAARSLREAFEQGTSAKVLHRVRARDGAWRWIEYSGRFYRGAGGQRFVSIGHDVTESKAENDDVERRLSAEHAIADLSRRFLNAPAVELDDALAGALDIAMDLAGADRTYLLSVDTRPPWCSEIFERQRDGIAPFGDRFSAVGPRQFPWSTGVILRNDVLCLPDTRDIPPEGAAEREDCLERGVLSMLGIPVWAGDHLTGFLCFECLSEHHAWTKGEVTELRIVAEIFAAALERRRAEEMLARQLSYEQRIAALSRTFLTAGVDEIDDAIRDALGETAELAGADRTYLLSFDHPGDGDFEFFEWVREESARASARALPWASERVLAGETLCIPRVAALPPEAAAERADLESRGVRSLLGIPVFSGRKLVGFLGIESIAEERWWSDQDITLLRLVSELFNSALHRRTAEHALRTSQEQLLQAQKMDAVGRLAGGIAHDFNNLLTVILGFSRALLDDLSDEEAARDDVVQIHESAERAAALTRQLLTFSRRQIVEAQQVDLSDRVRSVEQLLRRLLGEDVELVLDLSEEAGAVWGDPHQFEQVLINLAVNARDAMPDGGQLLVTTAVRDIGVAERRKLGLGRTGPHSVLQVSDSGCGIEEEAMSHIFEPFFTTKDPGHGTGLGLSIVYSVVEQAGGAIEVRGEPGKGTEFEILLPRIEIEDEGETPARGRDARRGQGVVLLAEDETSVRRLTRRILERQGYTVLEAPNGRDALQIARDHDGAIDLLLTDVVMPKMGGAELAEQIAEVRPGVPVLFVSGYPQDRGVASNRPLRCDAFLQKPFSAEAILGEVAALLAAKEPRES